MRTARKSPRPRKSKLTDDDVEVSIDSWEDLVETLSSLSASWTFRGQCDARWTLQSTLARRFISTGIHHQAWPEQENRIRGAQAGMNILLLLCRARPSTRHSRGLKTRESHMAIRSIRSVTISVQELNQAPEVQHQRFT